MHRSLVRAALAGAHVFAWIGAFQFAYARTGSIAEAFAGVALTYALMHTIMILLTPLAARNMRHGSRRTLEAAVLCAAAAFAALGGVYLIGDSALALGMLAFAILMGAYRALYYVPYELSGPQEARSFFAEICIALMPAIAGVALATAWNMPAALYIGAAFLIVCSLPFVFHLRDTCEGFSWGYRETFHELFDVENRSLLKSSLYEGLEATALLLVWPIAIWMMLDGSYPLLGVVMSATFLFTMLARSVLKRFRLYPSPRMAGIVHVSGWILRLFAGSAAAVLIIDIYSHAGSEPRKKGLDIMSFEHSSDNHTYVDEYTALKEMGQALGRILMCGVVVVLAASNSVLLILAGAFAIAALGGWLAIHAAHAHTRGPL